jgi:hypothetical protein
MKKNKGFLMGIAAMALLFSMAFLGCESATNGEQGLPGDARGLEHYFQITTDVTRVVTMGSGTDGDGSKSAIEFRPFYSGINIDPKAEIQWEVVGENFEAYPAGNGHDPATKIEAGSYGSNKQIGGGNAYLSVSTTEKSPYLTVKATYGGYTHEIRFEVGVPKIRGLLLDKGTVIGTTFIKSVGYTLKHEDGENTYLVYSRDSKEKTEVRNDEDLSLLKLQTAKVAFNGAKGVEYNIPIGQEEWLTIYEVPLATGAETAKHLTAKKFVSLPATKPITGYGSPALTDSNVRLPLDNFFNEDAGSTSLPALSIGYPTKGPNDTYSSGTHTYQTGNISYTTTGTTGLTSKTTQEHGGVTTNFSAYAVWYNPEANYGYESASGVPGTYPQLNTKFIPPTGNQPIKAAATPITLRTTGRWKVIIQYTDNHVGTGYGAWSYADDFLIKDYVSFGKTYVRADDVANTVHISLTGDKKWVKDIDNYGNYGSYFTNPTATDVVNVSRDSDTGVTLYLSNAARIVTGLQNITFTNQALELGSTPQANTDFFKISAVDQKYDSIIIGGVTPPHQFAVNAATVISIGHRTVRSNTFPLGGDSVTYRGEPATEVGYQIVWYYVDGTDWIPTGTPDGTSFTPTAGDEERTIGIRVFVEENKPNVMLLDINDISANITKFSTIGYGQRILGAVQRTP